VEKNNAGKYFKYAVGEIVLVVIGILIALQINNWNELRKEHLGEQVILRQLKKEFEANLQQLDQKVTIRENLINEANDLLSYFGSSDSIEEDILLIKFAAIVPTTFDPVDNDLIGSGRIDNLKNQEVKQLLTNWTTNVIQLQETEQMFLNYHENQIRPFMDKAGLTRNVAHYFWGQDQVMSLIDSDKAYNAIPGKSTIGPKMKEFLNNAQFESIITQTISLNVFNNIESHTLRGHIQKIIEAIQKELED
jgi:hypothetical protein